MNSFEPDLAKSLIIRFTLLGDRNPNHYMHVVASHLEEYLDYLEEISKKIGIKLSLKHLSQDAVEAHHK